MSSQELTLLKSVAAIVADRVEFDESSLTILDPEFTVQDVAALLSAFGRGKRAFSFYIGDLLNFAEGMFDEKVSQLQHLTGLGYETLTNYAWVCRRVSRRRRNHKVSFGIHSEVSPLPASEQRYWLAQAARHGWNRAQARDAIRAVRDPDSPAPPPADPLDARGVIEASASVATIQDALERLDAGEKVDLVPAFQALRRTSETITIAAQIPTIRHVAARLCGEAIPNGNGVSAVPTRIVDELAALVSQGGEE